MKYYITSKGETSYDAKKLSPLPKSFLIEAYAKHVASEYFSKNLDDEHIIFSITDSNGFFGTWRATSNMGMVEIEKMNLRGGNNEKERNG